MIESLPPQTIATIGAAAFGAVQGGLEGLKDYGRMANAAREQGRNVPPQAAITMPLLGAIREGSTDGVTIGLASEFLGHPIPNELMGLFTIGLCATELTDLAEATFFKLTDWYRNFFIG